MEFVHAADRTTGDLRPVCDVGEYAGHGGDCAPRRSPGREDDRVTVGVFRYDDGPVWRVTEPDWPFVADFIDWPEAMAYAWVCVHRTGDRRRRSAAGLILEPDSFVRIAAVESLGGTVREDPANPVRPPLVAVVPGGTHKRSWDDALCGYRHRDGSVALSSGWGWVTCAVCLAKGDRVPAWCDTPREDHPPHRRDPDDGDPATVCPGSTVIPHERWTREPRQRATMPGSTPRREQSPLRVDWDLTGPSCLACYTRVVTDGDLMVCPGCDRTCPAPPPRPVPPPFEGRAEHEVVLGFDPAWKMPPLTLEKTYTDADVRRVEDDRAPDPAPPPAPAAEKKRTEPLSDPESTRCPTCGAVPGKSRFYPMPGTRRCPSCSTPHRPGEGHRA